MIKPIDDKIVIIRDQASTVRESGLQLVIEKKELLDTGLVVAVGPGKMLDSGITKPVYIKVGDRVAFPKDTGVELKIKGTTYLVVIQDNLIGTIEEE